MTIKEIAEKLNDKAIKESFQIASLPEFRKKYLQKKTLPSKIFTNKTINEDYAFHHGGRDEWQFNFGIDHEIQNPFTRIALCLSLEPSRSLTDPTITLKIFKDKFNKCLKEHTEWFENFEMWIFQKDKRTENFLPQAIKDEWFKTGNFIAVGYVIPKHPQDLNENDLNNILDGFGKLFPIYEYCMRNVISAFEKAENKIARICWNENDWVSPSGIYGKSKNLKSHENEKGYGHEEWLFDFDKLIDGYHYSLLQPVQKGRNNFLNAFFDVKLFARNIQTDEIFWVGLIKNLEVISNEEAIYAHSIYKEKGWLDEMVEQLRKVNADANNILSLVPRDCFSVRFKPENAMLFNPYRSIADFKNDIGTSHYVFVNDKETSKNNTDKSDISRRRNFKFKSGKSEKAEAERNFRSHKSSYQIKPVHDILQNQLYLKLVEEYGERKVGSETDTGNLNRIDLCVNTNDGLLLYEVKSYPSVMISIRVALGQLFEYAFYPNPIEGLKEFVIVTHLPIDDVAKEYLSILRAKTGVNIYYQWLNIETNILSVKY